MARHLASVLVMEDELSQCRWHLQQLMFTLAEEWYKVGYMEVALVRRLGGGGLETGPDEKRWGPERRWDWAAADRRQGTITVASL